MPLDLCGGFPLGLRGSAEDRSATLKKIKERLRLGEKERLSPYATLSSEAMRRREEPEIAEGHRENFSLDADRILHSLAYSRYIDKTQVFYLIKNDHITHRVLHVQLVSKIGRTIGRLLGLNEDLIEAIALGHDLGHAPFGHDGEKLLSELSLEYGLGNFLHNVQGERFLEVIEKKGQGWNLSLQVLDGMLTHNGEVHNPDLYPDKDKDFNAHEQEISKLTEDPTFQVWPMTLEGCVVRMADTISYVGRDIEDAIRLGLITRDDLPVECARRLGRTNGTIVYNLVEDLLTVSLEKPFVSFSPEVADALKRLKDFNQERIYTHPRAKHQTHKLGLMFRLLFEKYYEDLRTGDERSVVFREFLDGMSDEYRRNTPPAMIVRDFIAGMTDDYFLRQCQENLMPQILSDHY
ncbi:MAG: HD domain-containing protein [Deltaproteobacteria bacterium]|nr:MAG: HD domain-containing protein [Deltaproteobacteria bacterium]